MKQSGWMVVAMMSFLFVLGSIEPVFAEGNEAAGSPVSSNSEPSGSSSSPSWYIPGWVDTLMKKIDGMWGTLQDLMSGQFLHDALNQVVTLYVEELFAPLYGVFAKCYLFTPLIAEMDLVYTGWTAISVACMVALILGALFVAKQIIQGKRSMQGLLKTMAVSLCAVFFSLTVMNMAQVGINWLTHHMLQGMLGTTTINYQGLQGQEIIKAMVIGTEALRDPVLMNKATAKAIIETEGGLITLYLATVLIVLPLFLLAALKILVLLVLGIFVGFWITTAAFSGRMEILVGFANLYIRTLLVGFFMALHWGLFVKAQTDYGKGIGISAELGIDPIWMSMLCVIGLCTWLFFFWIRPLVEGSKTPVTLGGGKVVERAGGWGEGASKMVHALGKRFGSESVQRSSLQWKDRSQQVAEYGKRLKEQQAKTQRARIASTVTGGASEAVQQIQYAVPAVWATETGSISMAMAAPTEHAISPQVTDAGLKEALEGQQFRAVTKLQFQDKDRAAANEVIQRIQRTKAELVQWNPQTGVLLVREDHPEGVQTIQDELAWSQLKAEQMGSGMAREDLFVDVAGRTVQPLHNQAIDPKLLQTIQQAVPVMSKMNLSQAEAEASYSYLQQMKGQHPWIENVQFDNQTLWVPNEKLKQAARLLERVVEKKEMVRFELPAASAFADELVQFVKGQHPGQEAAIASEQQGKAVLVQRDFVEAFQKTLELFQKERIPYWRTKGGRVKVIQDGVPVDFGGVPRKGLDMGSFEQLQKEAIRRHGQSKETVVTPNGASSP